jgi:hypothetical protein
LSYYFLEVCLLFEVIIKLATNVRGFLLLGIYFRQPTAAAKFIIKNSLFVTKFKDAGQASIA